jgi:hypothetical protein
MYTIYSQNTPFYGAMQWTGTNEQDIVDWIMSVQTVPLTIKYIDDVLHICYPNTQLGFWRIPLNHYLVSPETWGSGIPSPYGIVLSPTEFAARFTAVPE